MSSRVVPTRGMRDFLPTDKARREAVLKILRETYTGLGFQEIETPAIEPISRLKSGQGGENEKMLFEILRRGLDSEQAITPHQATDLGLRYDLTLPLSRYYATHMQELPSVFRAFQTGPVWRAERPQKGRFRQFNQVDIDIIGSDSFTAEVEVLATGWSAAKRLGLADQATILLNDRRLLLDLMQAVGVAEENYLLVLIVLDKLEKIGAEKVIAELVESQLASTEQAQRLLETVCQLQRSDLSEEVQDFQVAGIETVLSARDLPRIVQGVKGLHPDVEIKFAPTLVRGMGYYTGPIFEVVHREANSSICGGGRYDGVVGRWCNQDVPAVGLSFGFERIIDLVNLSTEQLVLNLALPYQKDAEALQALWLRDQIDWARSKGEISLERVGLFKAPRKLNGRFYDELKANGYNRVLLPSAYQNQAEQTWDLAALVASAKEL